MRRTITRLLVPIALLVVVAFAVTLANQTAQIVALAERAAPWLGDVVFWTLLALYAFCVAVPVYLWLRLPRALKPPPSESDEAYPAHVERLAARLSRNPHLTGRTIDTREHIDAALPLLDRIADERMKTAARQVFLTTAISQNGSLDTLLVLSAQSKLVLEIARVYYQRPGLRELTYLYGNVAATAFIAGELEDIDLAEQLQPVLAAAFGSAAGAIPGFGAATTLFVNSVTTGAANAFLTLRVGIIAKQYCRAVVLPERRALRRAAIVRATEMLGGVVVQGAGRVAAAVAGAAKHAVGDIVGGVADQIGRVGAGVRDIGADAFSRLRRPRRGGAGEAGPEGT